MKNMTKDKKRVLLSNIKRMIMDWNDTDYAYIPEFWADNVSKKIYNLTYKKIRENESATVSKKNKRNG